jgi:hypothetical protein
MVDQSAAPTCPQNGNTKARKIENTKGFQGLFFVPSPFRAFVFQRCEGRLIAQGYFR